MSAPPPGMSKEKHRALMRADAHFKADRPDWNSFVEHAKRKSFVHAVHADPRADAQLRRHVGQMHELLTGKKVHAVSGKEGRYTIVQKKDGGLACTCKDWRYRRSVSFGEGQDCKHIRAYKEAQASKTAGISSVLGQTAMRGASAVGSLAKSNTPMKALIAAGTHSDPMAAVTAGAGEVFGGIGRFLGKPQVRSVAQAGGGAVSSVARPGAIRRAMGTAATGLGGAMTTYAPAAGML